jgi:hypothetical protein
LHTRYKLLLVGRLSQEKRRVQASAPASDAALGKTEESTHHFEQAAAADPRGNFGRLAQQRRANLSSAL